MTWQLWFVRPVSVTLSKKRSHLREQKEQEPATMGLSRKQPSNRNSLISLSLSRCHRWATPTRDNRHSPVRRVFPCQRCSYLHRWANNRQCTVLIAPMAAMQNQWHTHLAMVATGPELAKPNHRPFKATDNVLIIVIMNLLVRPMLNNNLNRCLTVTTHSKIKSLLAINRCPTNSNSSTICRIRLTPLLTLDRYSAVWANSWEVCSRVLDKRLQDHFNNNSLVPNLANLVSNSNSGSINSSGTIVIIIIMTINSSSSSLTTIWGQEAIQHSRCLNKLMPCLEDLEVSILVSKWATSSSPMVSLWTDRIDLDSTEDAHKTL